MNIATPGDCYARTMATPLVTVTSREKHVRKIERSSTVSMFCGIVYSNDVNLITERFIRHLNELYCDCLPLKIKFVGRKRFDKPWIISSILRRISEKSRVFKQFKAGLVSDHFNRKIRNEVNVLVKNAKKQYYKTVFNKCTNDIGRTWKNIRKIIAGSKTFGIGDIRQNGAVLTNQD